MTSSWVYKGKRYNRGQLILVEVGFRLVASLWSGIHTLRDETLILVAEGSIFFYPGNTG